MGSDESPPLLSTSRAFVSNASLRRTLVAVASHAPLLGYCQGFNLLFSHALRWTSEADALAFVSLLIARVFLPGTFKDLDGAAVDQAVMGELLVTALPDVVYALNSLMSGRAILLHTSRAPSKFTDSRSVTDALTVVSLRWFLGAFAGGQWAPSFTDRIWDALVYDGPKVLFRTALALFRLSAPKMAIASSFGEAVAMLEQVPALSMRPRVFAALLDTWMPPARHISDSPRPTNRAASAETSSGVGGGSVAVHRKVRNPRWIVRAIGPIQPLSTVSSENPRSRAETANSGINESDPNLALSNEDGTKLAAAEAKDDANRDGIVLSSTLEDEGIVIGASASTPSLAINKRSPPARHDWGFGVSAQSVARLGVMTKEADDNMSSLRATAPTRLRRGKVVRRSRALTSTTSHLPDFRVSCDALGSSIVSSHYPSVGDNSALAFEYTDGEDEDDDELDAFIDVSETAPIILNAGDAADGSGDEDEQALARTRDSAVVAAADFSNFDEDAASGALSSSAPRSTLDAPSAVGGGSIVLSSPTRSIFRRYGGRVGAPRLKAPAPTALSSTASSIVNAIGSAFSGRAGGKDGDAPSEVSETLKRKPARASNTRGFSIDSLGLIWRERQSVGRGFIVSRRAALFAARANEMAETDRSGADADGEDTGDESRLAEALAAAVAASDGERMPCVNDGNSHSPANQSPLKRRVRTESGTSGPNLSRRESSVGTAAYEESVYEGPDGDADAEVLPEEPQIELIDAAYSARSVIESYAKCFRLFAFFYHENGRETSRQELLSVIDEYWLLPTHEVRLSESAAAPSDYAADSVSDDCVETHFGDDCTAPFGATARVLSSRDAEDGSRALVVWDLQASALSALVATHATRSTLDWLRGSFRAAAPPPVAVSSNAAKHSAAAPTQLVPADLPTTLAGAHVFGLYFAPFPWQRTGNGAGKGDAHSV
jgi:hypothetical protein